MMLNASLHFKAIFPLAVAFYEGKGSAWNLLLRWREIFYKLCQIPLSPFHFSWVVKVGWMREPRNVAHSKVSCSRTKDRILFINVFTEPNFSLICIPLGEFSFSDLTVHLINKMNEMNALLRGNHWDLEVILLPYVYESILYYVGAFVFFLMLSDCRLLLFCWFPWLETQCSVRSRAKNFNLKEPT